ncbi:MAG: hydrogenase maturation nickel metallochaperone HypA [Oscillospiraceae bacterium]
MHELAIAQNVLAIIEAEAKKRGFKRVITIRLAVGEYSGVVTECLRDFFPIASRDSVAEGAVLETRILPAEIDCLSCGYKGSPEGATCPSCGGTEFRLTAGREFFVDSIEVE